MTKPILYIIPGFGESPNDTAYRKIKALAIKAGYKPIGVPIKWERATFDNWLSEFENIYKKHADQPSSILGFSFGAMIAAVASEKHIFKKLFFCSISPYFKDNLSSLPESEIKYLGKRRVESFKKCAFPTTVKTPATFIMGTDDWPYGIAQIKVRQKKWKGQSSLILLEGVAHDIGDLKYLAEIKKLLK